MRELQKNIETVVRNWWESVKEKVTLHGLYYHYNGNSHDDNWEFEYHIAGDGGPFREHFEDIKEFDFSNCTYDKLYNISSKDLPPISNNYWETVYTSLDDIRAQYVATGYLNVSLYTDYLVHILNQTPEEYRAFYYDLSLVSAKEA